MSSDDHDEIWLRFWDQALYTLWRGPAAIGAVASLSLPDKPLAPGSAVKLPVTILSTGYAGPLIVALHVTAPDGQLLHVNSTESVIGAGQTLKLELTVYATRDWPAGLYPVYVSVGEVVTRKLLHQALGWLPVAGYLQLTATADKPGYRLGEAVTVRVQSALEGEGWDGVLAFGVFDWRGRLVATEARPVKLPHGKQAHTFTWTMADHGVQADTFRLQVVAVRDGKVWGRAAAKVGKYERWSMRNEYQWSTWAGIACAAPCLVPEAMQLMGHAGMNALGYPGRNELYYPAERWGWRYYNEGVGMNTWGPLIEYVNEAEIEAQLLKEAKDKAQNPDLASAALVLASVGEEAGFKNGWGTRYYWDTPVAPDTACAALQWYLRTRYPNLAALNQAWHTQYTAWTEVKLAREFSGVTPTLAADGWAHPKEAATLAGANTAGVSLAPYQDTAAFYNWYYDRIVNTARRILRETINPVTLAMSSAPTIGSADYDARVAAPGAWNESQNWSLLTGPEPGFGLIWGHFDWQVMTENLFWGFLLARSGHNNYWVDIPLMFNNDMTHTRASMAMRRWTQRFAGQERLILDSFPAPAEAGILPPNGVGTTITETNMRTSLAVALKQAGFEVAQPRLDDDLTAYKVLFAVGRQAVSAEEAMKLNAFVERGGTLVFFPRFACQTPLGVPETVTPGAGLAAAWGIETSAAVRTIAPGHDQEKLTVSLDGVAPELKGAVLSGFKVFPEAAKAPDWQTLATYPDTRSALLSRALGKGRLVFVNAVYQSHWYIQWVTPTGAERQGFYRLVEWLCTQAGAQRSLQLEGDLAEMLHVAVTQFTDNTGDIHYVIARTSGEVPWVSGGLVWRGSQRACYSVLSTDESAPRLLAPVAAVGGLRVPLHLRPGAGRLLAFVDKPVHRLKVQAAPGRIVAGQSLTLSVKILARDGNPVAGCFPLECRVRRTDGTELRGLSRSLSLKSGGCLVVNTALNDPPGTWEITVTEAISGMVGCDTVRVASPKTVATAPVFEPWGWPSEQPEPPVLAAAEFLQRLDALATLYRTDHAADGWMAKQNLGFFYDNFTGTRHTLLRPLLEVDWRPIAAELAKAVTAGARLVLTGEDLGLDPGTGLGVWPRGKAHAFDALTQALKAAKWYTRTPDGDTLVAYLGKGTVTLCRESIDAAGNTNPEVVRWQQRWLAELKKGGEAENNTLPVALPAPDASTLMSWWAGRRVLAPKPRTVTWFAGNQREIKVTAGPELRPAPVLLLTVPPLGDALSATIAVSAVGVVSPGDITLDVGLDGTADGTVTVTALAAGQPVNVDLTGAVRGYLARGAQPGATGAYHDGNGWRLVPVRVSAAAKAEITVTAPVMVVK